MSRVLFVSMRKKILFPEQVNQIQEESEVRGEGERNPDNPQHPEEQVI